MSAVDHAHIEELVAGRALGGLDASESAELADVLAAHGATCPECRRMVSEYEEVAGRLAFAVAPDEIPGGLEDRVVEATRPSRPRSFGVRAIAATAAAALIVAGGVGGYLLRGGAASPRVVSLASSNVNGSIALVYPPNGGTSYLVASDVPTLRSDLVYELWAIRGTTPVPAGTFTVTGKQTIAPVGADIAGADQVAVTVEHAPGAKRPTTKPIFAATL